ncbi:MAG: PD-(D/E)XK nuclease family protein [Candidatus Helarchaeales archaeon]
MTKMNRNELGTRELYKKDLMWIFPSKVNDYDFCPGLFEDRWLQGIEVQKTEKMMIGHDIHEIAFWFYKAIEDENKIKLYLADSFNEGFEEGFFAIQRIYEHVVPDSVKKDRVLLNMVYNHAKLEATRLDNIRKYLDVPLRKQHVEMYFIPVLAEHKFSFEKFTKFEGRFKENGILDRLDRMPPGYEFQGKEIKFFVGEYKSSTPLDYKRWMKLPDDQKRKKKLKLKTRYRRQLSFYVDFCIEYFKDEDFTRDDFGVFVEFLDTGIIIPEILSKRTYNSRDKLVNKIRGEIKKWEQGNYHLPYKPYYRKCEECGRKEGCPAYSERKGFIKGEL